MRGAVMMMTREMRRRLLRLVLIAGGAGLLLRVATTAPVEVQVRYDFSAVPGVSELEARYLSTDGDGALVHQVRFSIKPEAAQGVRQKEHTLRLGRGRYRAEVAAFGAAVEGSSEPARLPLSMLSETVEVTEGRSLTLTLRPRAQ